MKKSRLIATILAGCAAATMLTGVAQAAATKVIVHANETFWLCVNNASAKTITQNVQNVASFDSSIKPGKCDGNTSIKINYNNVSLPQPGIFTLNLSQKPSTVKVQIHDSGTYSNANYTASADTITINK